MNTQSRTHGVRHNDLKTWCGRARGKAPMFVITHYGRGTPAGVTCRLCLAIEALAISVLKQDKELADA